MSDSTASGDRRKLISILRSAYSGELAAAYAYRGHWKSVRDKDEKRRIRQIEEEEWEHRECVLGWLNELEAKPKRTRESIFWTIGRVLGVLCFVSGWFFPMYCAGRLESQNTQEYDEAAEFAEKLGMEECAADMQRMSAKELEHEQYFSKTVANHRLLPIMKTVFKWS